VCPGADKLNVYTFGMEQALRATTAHLQVPCKVLSWLPILGSSGPKSAVSVGPNSIKRLNSMRLYVPMWASSANSRRPRLKDDMKKLGGKFLQLRLEDAARRYPGT
jgi:hypothetical protein